MPFIQKSRKILNAAAQMLGRTLAVGAGASLLAFTAPADALETIIIRYNQDEVTVTLDDILDFAATGDLPELEQLLIDQEDILQEAAEDILNVLQDALTEEVRLSARLRGDIESFLNSTTGEFLLTQLEQVITRADNTSDLESIRAALVDVYEEQDYVSVLTLIQAYPEDIVKINASGLEGVVRDVDSFITEIEPALQAIKDVLQDIICDCPPRDESNLPTDELRAECRPTSDSLVEADIETDANTLSAAKAVKPSKAAQ
ncbi:alpha/beta hydrolase [Baaleninema simplex]|uniref:alpha/beta hydrolase n=1 Tax=Baaleninema simplex TaxID=2862350 RepID=UPI000349C10D|nr:alpha/beta hydrolase [Baaleninema simplex]